MKKNNRNSKFTNEILVLIFVSFSILFSCTDKNKVEKLKKPVSSTLQTGELLAKQYCASCHEFVPPEILPKKYWKNVLSKMSMFLGVNDQSFPNQLNTQLAMKRLDSASIFPSKQIITDMQWQSIKYYYMNKSAEKLNQGERPKIDFNISQFKLNPIRLTDIDRQPTFVQILAENKIGIGFSSSAGVHEFSVINTKGKEIQNVLTPSPLTSISQIDDTMYMTFMGPFVADDNPVGLVGKMKVDSIFNLKNSIENTLPHRERPIHVNVIDSDNNGRQDLVVAEFGKYLGGLFLYVQNQSGEYNKKVLYKGAGAISSIIKDVNNDGLPDVYGLISQGNEGVYLYINKGNNEFEEKKLLEFPPYYGSTHFDIVDFDSDGKDDIIYSNGDSGDFGIIPKPFHGIRMFKNYGNELYKEEWFYPQQGTSKTVVIDFDQDGDFDIASIGFYACRTIPQESFLYLENLSDQKEGVEFKAYTFKNATRSSYLVMEAGDIDNDGDIDLVLGASSMLMTKNEKEAIFELWKTDGGLITVLENNLN